MTARVARKLVGRAMADSMSSSVEDDDNSLDGRTGVQGDRRQSLDYANVYHSPTVPKSEEKPRRRTSTRPAYASGDLMTHFNGSDPVRLELTRLENEVRGKPHLPHRFRLCLWASRLRDGMSSFLRSCAARAVLRSYDHTASVGRPSFTRSDLSSMSFLGVLPCAGLSIYGEAYLVRFIIY